MSFREILLVNPLSFANLTNRSSKDDLEEHGRTIGIELDKRKSKKSLLKELKDFVKK